MENWKAYGLKFGLMSIAALVGPGLINPLFIKYISFLNSFATPVASFITIFLLLLGIHFLTKSVWSV